MVNVDPELSKVKVCGPFRVIVPPPDRLPCVAKKKVEIQRLPVEAVKGRAAGCQFMN